MKLGLLGGTFNPPHRGHLTIAHEVFCALHLDQLLFIPAPIPPHKAVANEVSFDHRVAMTRAAISAIDSAAVSEIEGQRRGKSYTVDTLQAVQRQHPEASLYFIMGGDSYRDLPTWHQWPRLFDLAHIVVLHRPGFNADRQVLAPVAIDPALCYDSGRDRIPCRSGNTAIFLEETSVKISSSEIRRRVAAGESIDELVPPAVDAYIQRHGLYSN